MINPFLQFLKQQQLAIKLARADSPAILRFLPGALSQLLGRLFTKHCFGTPAEKLQDFMSAADDPILTIFITEVGYRLNLNSPSVFRDSPYLLESEVSEVDAEFYSHLFRSIIRKNSSMRPAYQSFRRRLDLLQDKRFAAAELEELSAKSRNFNHSLSFEVDWPLTDKKNLCLNFAPDTKFTDSLSSLSQQNLVALFGFLFFETDTLLSGWQQIAHNSDDKVNFFNPDSLLVSDSTLKNFAVKFITSSQTPSSWIEYKFVTAFNLLKSSCPKVDVKQVWESYIQAAPFRNSAAPSSLSANYLNSLKKTDYAAGLNSQSPSINPQELSYLLYPKREKARRHHSNSSMRIWLPLLIAIYLLYKYF